MTDTTFTSYAHLPEDIRKHLLELESFISDLDGKTLCTPVDDGRAFLDDGTIYVESEVRAFNAIVATLAATSPSASEQQAARIRALERALGEMRCRDDRNGSLPIAYRQIIDAALASRPTPTAGEG